jgi:formiminoglutamase
MLQNWLNPIAINEILGADTTTRPTAILHQIQCYDTEFPTLDKARIALIGLEATSANSIRKALYQFNTLANVGIVDLGNLKKENPAFYISLLTELLQSGIIPVVIGNASASMIPLFQAFKPLKHNINIVSIERNVSDDWEQILDTKRNHLLHIGLIGYQSHIANLDTLSLLDQRNADLARLGRIRNSMDEMEPIIRYADMISVDINALKYSEAPAQQAPSPSGLTVEEACMLVRYAGMSDKSSALNIQGYWVEKDIENQTAQTVAELIWYFMEGVSSRKNDFPVSLDNMTEYIVDYKMYGYQLTFWRSNKSSRWWIQIPVKAVKEKDYRHKLIPCSYQDYQQASEGKIPDRLLRAFSRFG